MKRKRWLRPTLSAWWGLAKQGKLVPPAAAGTGAEAKELPTSAPLVLREPEEPVEREASPQSGDLLRIVVGVATPAQ